MSIIVEIPLEIPDGETCKFSNGEVCRLFRWNQEHEEFPRCRGWGGEKRIKPFYKHQDCLTRYYLTTKRGK